MKPVNRKLSNLDLRRIGGVDDGIDEILVIYDTHYRVWDKVSSSLTRFDVIISERLKELRVV